MSNDQGGIRPSRRNKKAEFNWGKVDIEQYPLTPAEAIFDVEKEKPTVDALRHARKVVALSKIEKHLPTALETKKKYVEFVNLIGYRSDFVPPYENVESITLEGDKLCINEIPIDDKTDDIKPEIE